MKGIAEFLAKFKVIPNPKDEKRILAEIITKEVAMEGFQMDESNIEVRGYFIYINIHPAFKNLIFQKKEQILTKINDRFNKEKVFKGIN